MLADPREYSATNRARYDFTVHSTNMFEIHECFELFYCR